jgi:hypothetical protein
MAFKIIRGIFLAAALLALAASAYILLTPLPYVEIDSETGAILRGTSTWLERQGWWGVFVLMVYAAVYTLPAAAYSRGSLPWALIFGVLAAVLTWLAGFSIGPAYFPALSLLIIALGVAGIHAIWERVRIGESPDSLD